MQWFIGISVMAVLAIAAIFGFLLRRLASGSQTLPVTAEWIDELSVERYRPMLRLLSEEDLRYLAAQPGYNAKMAWQFRAQRCQIFRGYLKWMHADFQRICMALRLLMLQSQHDRPDLAAILLKQRITFTCGMASIQARMWFYQLGLTGVDVESVMASFDCLRVELRQLVPATSDFAA